MKMNLLNRLNKLESKLNQDKPQVFFITENANKWVCMQNNKIICEGDTPEQVESKLVDRYGNNITVFIDDISLDD